MTQNNTFRFVWSYAGREECIEVEQLEQHVWIQYSTWSFRFSQPGFMSGDDFKDQDALLV